MLHGIAKKKKFEVILDYYVKLSLTANSVKFMSSTL